MTSITQKGLEVYIFAALIFMGKKELTDV